MHLIKLVSEAFITCIIRESNRVYYLFLSQIVDETPGDVAGVKSSTLIVEGLNAYG